MIAGHKYSPQVIISTFVQLLQHSFESSVQNLSIVCHFFSIGLNYRGFLGSCHALQLAGGGSCQALFDN